MEGLETEKTIYNVRVPMESQEQCDRMKKLCIENGLPIWNDWNGWYFIKGRSLSFEKKSNEFFCYEVLHKDKITETEFIELLKQHKK